MSSHLRLATVPQGSFFLFGPRGTGKTTWLKKVLPEAFWVDLLREDHYQRYLVDPGLFGGELRTVPEGSWVVVDEIQRLPNLLNEVHRLIEERRLRFALSGSSARKLNRAGVNLLAGRAIKRAMHPFLPVELGMEFSLERALRIGLMPVVTQSFDPEESLTAYGQNYLREEIQAEALARNLAGFARFLPISALCHGQVVNVSGLARDAGVARTTVIGYLEILEQTLLCFRLPAYSARLRVRERHHPKWYWCDPGLARRMKGNRGALGAEEKGSLFEGLVAQVLRAYRDYRDTFDEFFFWAPCHQGKIEVDFILKRGADLFAIEVKAGERFQEGWLTGLRAIASLPGLRGKILVLPEGRDMRTKDGIDILSFASLNDRLEKGLFH